MGNKLIYTKKTKNGILTLKFDLFDFLWALVHFSWFIPVIYYGDLSKTMLVIIWVFTAIFDFSFIKLIWKRTKTL